MSHHVRHFDRCACGALIKNITAKNPVSVCRMCGGMTGQRKRIRTLPVAVTPRQVFSPVPAFDPVAARIRWGSVR